MVKVNISSVFHNRQTNGSDQFIDIFYKLVYREKHCMRIEPHWEELKACTVGYLSGWGEQLKEVIILIYLSSLVRRGWFLYIILSLHYWFLYIILF